MTTNPEDSKRDLVISVDGVPFESITEINYDGRSQGKSYSCSATIQLTPREQRNLQRELRRALRKHKSAR